MYYGLLITKFGANLGDDIQSLAAMHYLPKVDNFIFRDKISEARVKPDTRTIINGWFMHNTRYWPPHQNITPLFVSFHARPKKTLCSSEWLCDKILGYGRSLSCIEKVYSEYYNQLEPIGCRDTATLKAFNSIGIKAYFTGCLSLTLPCKEVCKTDNIVFVDPFGPLPYTNYRPELWLKLPKQIRNNATKLTHLNFSSNIDKRFLQAQDYLDIYQKASLVITSRLHVALPCIAFGTPLIMIASKHRDYRLSGYQDILQPVSADDFVTASMSGEIKSLVTKVDPKFLFEIKNNLIKICQKFISAD